MLFTKTNVDTILNEFKKTVSKLRQHEADMYAEEASRAAAAAFKIEALITE